jgi:hypothetical protein
MELQFRKRESDEALMRPELKFGDTVPINEDPQYENYVPNKSLQNAKNENVTEI